MTSGPAAASIPRAALVLGFAGLLPFAAGALAMWIHTPFLDAPTGLKLVTYYGAIILSFLGGIRWGTAIGPYDSGRISFELSASVLGSLAGLAAVFLPPIPSLTLLITGFLMQALWDITSVEAGRLPQWFGKLRTLLTGGAVLAMIFTLVAVVVS
jgi:hypothetical protein